MRCRIQYYLGVIFYLCLTYLFISHDLSVVKFMSDRMIVMKEVKIEEEGLADEIYANPKSEYTRSLINSIPKGRIEYIIVNHELKKSNSNSVI